jgi:uncharacterized protein (DUF952 family)
MVNRVFKEQKTSNFPIGTGVKPIGTGVRGWGDGVSGGAAGRLFRVAGFGYFRAMTQALRVAQPIYHIATLADWRQAMAEGRYHGSALCRADGFIHMSTAAQVPGTLARFFEDREDLVLLTADSAALGVPLRWDEVPGTGTFPHYYGVLDIAQVRLLGPIALDGAGRHVLSDLDTDLESGQEGIA